MTTERSEDYETPLAGLPLFTQALPPLAEKVEATRPLGSLAHLSTVSSAPPGRTLDWSLVSALRAQASEQLSQAVAADRGRLDKVAQAAEHYGVTPETMSTNPLPPSYPGSPIARSTLASPSRSPAASAAPISEPSDM